MKKITSLFGTILVLFASISAFGREARLVRYPHYHNGRIVFTYLGDLWTADENGQNVQRLTVNRARDVYGRFSPDGKWVSSILSSPPEVLLLPTGAGQTKRLERSGFEQFSYSTSWLADGKSVVFNAKESGHLLRTYVQSVDGGPPRPVTPEGITGSLVSPDGQFLLARDLDEKQAIAIYPLNGGEPRPIPGLEEEDRVIRWGVDGRSLYVYRPRERPLKLFKLNLATGKKEAGKEIVPADLSGIRGPINVLLTPDGRGYIYAFTRSLSDLYLVTGLK